MSKKTQSKDLNALVRLGHVIDREIAGRDRLVDAPASQAALGAILELDRSAKALADLRKKLREALVEHLRAGKCAEKGPLVAALQVSETRRPAWKEIATDQAAKLAKARGRKFSPAKWLARIFKHTPKSPSYGVKIEPTE